MSKYSSYTDEVTIRTAVDFDVLVQTCTTPGSNGVVSHPSSVKGVTIRETHTYVNAAPGFRQIQEESIGHTLRTLEDRGAVTSHVIPHQDRHGHVAYRPTQAGLDVVRTMRDWIATHIDPVNSTIPRPDNEAPSRAGAGAGAGDDAGAGAAHGDDAGCGGGDSVVTAELLKRSVRQVATAAIIGAAPGNPGRDEIMTALAAHDHWRVDVASVDRLLDRVVSMRSETPPGDDVLFTRVTGTTPSDESVPVSDDGETGEERVVTPSESSDVQYALTPGGQRVMAAWLDRVEARLFDA